MRAVIQRVSNASVSCESGHFQEIGNGLLVLVGIEDSDDQKDVDWLSAKISNLRIFPDEKGIMNKSVLDTDGEMMVISQFTLHASTKKGKRPSYQKAAKPEKAIPVYQSFLKKLSSITEKNIRHGIFGDHMDVKLVNDGPVTLFIDTKNKE